MKLLYCLLVCLFFAIVNSQIVPPNCGDIQTCEYSVNNGTDHIVSIKKINDTVTTKTCIKLFDANLCVDVTINPLGDFYEKVNFKFTLEGVDLGEFTVTLPDIIYNGGICLDTASIIEALIEWDYQGLSDQIQLLINIMKFAGCVPGGLFNICITFVENEPAKNIIISESQVVLDDPPKDGCYYLDVQFLYFEEWCVYASMTDLFCTDGTSDGRIRFN
eukprot:TRINITY_DN14352_c0_g1_i1.p1 TRINITY_DN14352_c0_g1~~TRINITY_DN14352_c0_g1_i1.p1  ORF type:complete len:218 (+),score=70.66 TRINITY_DN14352_c0_g1_i1:57-710(+)